MSLNPAAVCTLSDILMNDAEEKYFLLPEQMKRLLPVSMTDHREAESIPSGVSCTLTSDAGGVGGKTGLYQVGFPIKEATRKGYKMAYPGDSIDLAYPQMNTRRGRVGRKIAHTLTTDATQGTLIGSPQFVDMNEDPEITDIARCLTAKQNGGIRKHKREASGVLIGGRIRRLTPRECLRLQGWADDRIDKILAIQSDNQVYRQAGNGVTVNVVEAIGKRLVAMEKGMICD